MPTCRGRILLGSLATFLLAGQADAAVVQIVPGSYAALPDDGADPNANLSMPDANLAVGGVGWFVDFPFTSTTGNTPSLAVLNRYVWMGAATTVLSGMVSGSNEDFSFAIDSNTAPASPRRLTAGDTVNELLWTNIDPSPDQIDTRASFYIQDIYTAPDWGAGSYIGFGLTQASTSQVYFGYLEITWDSASLTFQVLSGAYEATPHTAITIPAQAVPGGGVVGLAALGLAGMVRRRHR